MSLDKLHGVAESGLKDQLKQLGFDVSGDVRSPSFHSEALIAHFSVRRPWVSFSHTT